MRALILSSFLLILALAACNPAAAPSGPRPEPLEGSHNPYLPQPGDGDLQRDPLQVSNVSLMTTSSLPVRIGVSFTYALPTVCHQLRVAVSAPGSAGRIDLEIYTVVDPDEACILIAPQPVSETILIGVLPEGVYGIYVNGEKAGEISAPAEGAFENPDQAVTSPPMGVVPDPPAGSATEPAAQLRPYDPQPGDGSLGRGEVFIDSSSILVLESYPPQFRLTLSGSLPTPCHQLRAVVAAPDAQGLIAVEVYSLADPSVICAQVLEPFTVSIDIPTPPQGRYGVTVNGEAAGEISW